MAEGRGLPCSTTRNNSASTVLDVEFDERFTLWRLSHIQLVKRIIGLDVMSLKGVPAHQLWEGVKESFFSELWSVVNAVTFAPLE